MMKIFSGSLPDKVPQVFGMKNLFTEHGEIINGESVENCFVEYYWMAQLSNFHNYHSPADPSDWNVIAVVKTETWCRGVLLSRPQHPPYEREFAGPNPFYPVELPNEDDPFVSSLHTIDLFPSYKVIGLREFGTYMLRLEIGSPSVYGMTLLHGPLDENPSHQLMFASFMKVIDQLLDLYGSDELREAFEARWM
jgi:hypothetical protein